MPMGRLSDAHVPATASSVNAKRKRWQPHSVSSLLHLPHEEHALVSGGASDGTVKLWDCRMLAHDAQAARRGKKPAPTQQLQPSTKDRSRPHGIASLAIDRVWGRLAVSTTDDAVYLYDSRWTVGSRSPRTTEVAQLRGHLCDSFYVKSAFSPDGRFLVHGSSDASAHIWEIDRPLQPPLVLMGYAASHGQ